MIITKDEYYDMGFHEETDEKLDSAITRAEFVISGLTHGKYTEALAAGGKAAKYIKQATAFQANLILEQENQSAAAEESCSLGDFSYKASREESGYSHADETSTIIIRLLMNSGCLFGGIYSFGERR